MVFDAGISSRMRNVTTKRRSNSLQPKPVPNCGATVVLVPTRSGETWASLYLGPAACHPAVGSTCSVRAHTRIILGVRIYSHNHGDNTFYWGGEECNEVEAEAGGGQLGGAVDVLLHPQREQEER